MTVQIVNEKSDLVNSARSVPLAADEVVGLVAERDHWKATAERACRRVTELLARTSELELAVESYRAELVAKESRIVDLEGVLEDQIGYVPNIKTACDGCGAPIEISEGSARLCADCDGEDY